jgi:hypothetical protein
MSSDGPSDIKNYLVGTDLDSPSYTYSQPTPEYANNDIIVNTGLVVIAVLLLIFIVWYVMKYVKRSKSKFESGVSAMYGCKSTGQCHPTCADGSCA